MVHVLWAVVHITAAFIDWATVTLHLRSERKFDNQLDAKIDPDIERLLQTVRVRAAAATSLSRKTFGDKWGDAVGDIERNGELPATAIMQAYFNAAWKLFEEEAHDIVDLPPSGDVIKRARYLDYLIDRAQRLKDPDALIDAFVRATANSFTQFSRTLSPLAFQPDDAPATFATISLRDAIRNIPAAVDALFIPFIADNVAKLGLFSRYRAHFATLDEKPPIPEDASTDLIDTYFTNTPFANFFTTKVPFTIPTSRLLEHCVIVAGSGMEKRRRSALSSPTI